MTNKDRPTYLIEVTPKPGVLGDQAVRSLRALLKTLGRAYGLRCTLVEPLPYVEPEDAGDED